MLDTKACSEVGAKRLHTEAFRGVMTGGNKRDAALTRQMHLRLGDFAGDEGVHAERDRVLEIALRAAGAPGDARNALRRIADDLECAERTWKPEMPTWT